MVKKCKILMFIWTTALAVAAAVLLNEPWWVVPSGWVRAIEVIRPCSMLGMTAEEASRATRIVRDFLGETLDKMEKANATKAQIEIQSADLDGDGTPEILTRVYHSGYCGSAGCTVIVLQRKGSGEWRSLFEALSENIEVGGTRKTGMCDLIFRSNEGQPKIFRWDGKKYRALEAQGGAKVHRLPTHP